MKKTTLLAATALLTALIASGYAQAKDTVTMPINMPKSYEIPTDTTAQTSAPSPTVHENVPMMHPGMPGNPMMPQFSEATEKMMRDSFAKMHEENKGTFEALMAKHAEMDAIVRAPSFDKKAFLAKRAEIDVLRDKLEASRVQTMASVMEKMPAAERAQMGPGMGMGMMMQGRHMMGKDGKGCGMHHFRHKTPAKTTQQ